MSAYTDNVSFLENVLSVSPLDTGNLVYGLWVSAFQNVNHSSNGYSYPQPLVNDLLSVDFAVTGKRFSIFNTDGKHVDVKFFITSGEKGSAFYDTNVIAADISDTYVSGESPAVIFPGLEFDGTIYRKQEITGLVNSINPGTTVLSVSGEDWLSTSISVPAADSLTENVYIDSNYNGYSNEVQTKYKLLYDDSSNSVNQNLSIFDIPTQIENGANLRYRISRKSDPLGTYITPEITSDGKMIIDYSDYSDEVSKRIDSNINYDFNQIAPFKFPQGAFENIDLDEKFTRVIFDENITGLEVAKQQNELSQPVFTFKILPNNNQSFSGIYKIDFSIDRFKETTSQNVLGYVMSSYNTGDGDVNLNLQAGDQIYPRNIQSDSYDSNYLLNLVNQSEIEFNEQYIQTQEEEQYSDSEGIENEIEKSFNYRNELFEELIDFDPTAPVKSDKNTFNKYSIDEIEAENQFENNYSTELARFALPTLSLPKETVDKEFYSNYLNSGESYVALPLIEYPRDPSFVYYGDQFGRVGYFIENNDNPLRTTVNSTSQGININRTDFCKGDSAVYANQRSDSIIFLNGLDLNITASDGVIQKQTGLQNWKNDFNYFYAKNYVYSFDIFPNNSEESNQKAFSNALGKAAGAAGTGAEEFAGKSPRLFIEREIYVEDYDFNQSVLLSSALSAATDNNSDAELVAETSEKLYGVQVFDQESTLVKTSSNTFLQSFDYEERINFKSFIGLSNLTYSELNGFNTVYVSAGNTNIDGDLYRLEYVIANSFTQADLSSAGFIEESLNGGDQIPENMDFDITLYSYHMYGYDGGGSSQLTLIKANVKPGDEISTDFSNVLVVKFIKKTFLDQYTKVKVGGEESIGFVVDVLKSNGSTAATSEVFFNLQAFDYNLAKPIENSGWYSNKINPYNNDTYGANNTLGAYAPRFFEDTPEDQKAIVENLLNFPNGPSTSKNYEGSVVSTANMQSLLNGVIKNKVIVTEQNGVNSQTTNFIVDFSSDGKIRKGQKISNQQSAEFTNAKRLKITRLRYNIYTKDLVILGDAGFPYAVELNTGWEYKLQYRLKNSSDWTELETSTSLSNSSLKTTAEFPSPFLYLSRDLDKLGFLSYVQFRTNLPKFLDDANYEFRIFKYEKLVVPFDNLDIVRKTNLLPVNVSWTPDNQSEYYNIYQVDTGNNYKLLDSVDGSLSSSYVLPSLKQSYFDLGTSTYPVNGDGYYNIVVSGVLPSVKEVNVAVSGQFDGNRIGNDNASSGQYDVVLNQGQNYQNQYNAISNGTYASIINFNNPEAKESEFTIDQKYDKYYFVSDSSNGTLETTVSSDFEAYAVNTGSSNCTLAGQTVTQNNGVSINGTSVSSINLETLPASNVSLTNNQTVLIDTNITVEDLFQDEVFTVVNDSSSQKTVTLSGGNSISISANQTQKFRLTSSSTMAVEGNPYSNVEQNTNTIITNKPTVNLNHSTLSLSDDVSSLAIYNYSKTSLTVNNTLSLDPDSLYLVDWQQGSDPTGTKINGIDFVKIYIDGQESETNFYLTDDTNIILTSYEGEKRDYFFVKNQNIQRDLNVKIINGSEEFITPIIEESFRLRITKNESVVSYEILYATNTSLFSISGDKEQLILIEQNDSDISLEYIDSRLKTGSVIYFVNKSKTSVRFFREDQLDPQENSLGANEIGKVYYNKNDQSVSFVKINKNNLPSLFFDLTGQQLLKQYNLLNLKFCDTEIFLPSNSDIASNENYLIIKNVAQYNKINSSSFESDFYFAEEESSLEPLNENLFKLKSGSSKPALNKIKFESSVFSNLNDKEYNYIYVNDDNLNIISLRDDFGRSSKKEGYIITKTERTLEVNSFDEIYNYKLEKADSFKYKFDQGDSIDGSLYSEIGDDFIVLNSQGNVTNSSSLNTFCANFAVELITFSAHSNKVLKKNRLASAALSEYFPIYNDEEFFINGSFEKYNILPSCDVETIALPFNAVNFELRNFSSKQVNIITIDSDGTSPTIINPNKKITFTANVHGSPSDITANDLTSDGLAISTDNQSSDYYNGEGNPYKTIFEEGLLSIADESGSDFINLEPEDDLSIYTTGIISIGRVGEGNSDKKYLNNFYLKFFLGNNYIYNSEIWDNGEAEYKILQREIYDLANENIIERILIDDNDDAIVVPFYRELLTLCLPNGKNNENKIAQGKKIIFVNLVKCSEQAPNKVYNYTDDQFHNIFELNSTIEFEADGQGGWDLVAEEAKDSPVYNYYATLNNITGLGPTESPSLSRGKELFIMPNIDSFKININSFERGEFRNFYLYNSVGLDKVKMFVGLQNPREYDLNTLNKMYFDGSFYQSKKILFIKNEEFLETENFDEESFSGSAIGTVVKTGNVLNQKNTEETWKKLTFFGFGSKAEFQNNTNCDIDVQKLIENSDSFFIYGSSIRNQDNLTFDTYNLCLNNLSQNSNFYIFNNTKNVLTVKYAESASLKIPSLRMVQINKDQAILLQTRRKGQYYISNTQGDRVNYLIKNNEQILFDFLASFSLQGDEKVITPKGEEFLVTSLVNNQTLIDVRNFRYNEEGIIGGEAVSQIFNPSILFFTPETNFVPNGEKTPVTKSQYIIDNSNGGHYLFNSNTNDIKITLYSNYYYLINNTPYDINVFYDQNSKFVLYRNTVLVINSAKTPRYLKKAKSRDEFYSIFNPKTVISTEREIANVLGLESYKELSPVFNIDFVEIPSSVTLYSKTGSQTKISLNISNFYEGIDIPSDTSQNIVAYQGGIGHETIYKFKFYDPSSSYYTLPGIQEGAYYKVEVDNSFFYSLTLNNVNAQAPKTVGKVKYMGVEYENGEEFEGKSSNWYEVNYPNFVTVYKIIKDEYFPLRNQINEVPESENLQLDVLTQSQIDEAEQGEVVQDDLALFKEAIFNQLPSTLAFNGGNQATLSWIPKNELAFWLDNSSFTKNIWEIDSIVTGEEDSEKTLTFGSNFLTFKKCILKNTSLRTPVQNFSYTFYSALQPKIPLSNSGNTDVTIGFDYNLTPNQKNRLKGLVQSDYNKKDEINSDGNNFTFASLEVSDLLLTRSDVPPQLVGSKVEVSFRLTKLNAMPKVNIEDFSTNQVIKILNRQN